MRLLLMSNLIRCPWCKQVLPDQTWEREDFDVHFCCEADLLGLAPPEMEAPQPVVDRIKRRGWRPYAPAWQGQLANLVSRASYHWKKFWYRRRIGL